jgi:hypothetical protein
MTIDKLKILIFYILLNLKKLKYFNFKKWKKSQNNNITKEISYSVENEEKKLFILIVFTFNFSHIRRLRIFFCIRISSFWIDSHSITFWLIIYIYLQVIHILILSKNSFLWVSIVSYNESILAFKRHEMIEPFLIKYLLI